MTTRVLALDAATDACSAAVWVDGRVVARRFAVIGRGHAEALMPMVDGALAESGVRYGDIDLIGVTVGPGAFTGIRIGLAAARGLALALARPCLGLTTLEAVARAVPSESRAAIILAAMESKRADLFVQVFAPDLTPITGPAAVSPEVLAGFIAAHASARDIAVAGDGAVRACPPLAAAGFAARAVDAAVHPDAAVIAGLAWERWQALGRPAALDRPRPLYLRAPDTTAPKKP